ncbi:MAG TPA: HEAT repeat domain-containing protein, partial [Stellaceae bacterium]|nr:HEAT repeat domain-containing protein [Stellaceae bacterium]
RDRFLRNVLIAIGNSQEPRLIAAVKPLLPDKSPLVRAMAVWALARLGDRNAVDALREAHLPKEEDEAVRAEWRRAA